VALPRLLPSVAGADQPTTTSPDIGDLLPPGSGRQGPADGYPSGPRYGLPKAEEEEVAAHGRQGGGGPAAEIEQFRERLVVQRDGVAPPSDRTRRGQEDEEEDEDVAKPKAGISQKDLRFEANECFDPADLEPLIMAPLEDCDRDLKENPGQAVKFGVLQKARAASFHAIECYARISVQAFRCAGSGHAEIFTELTKTYQPEPIEPEFCQLAYDTGVFYIPEVWFVRKGVNQTIERNGTTYFRSIHTGHTERYLTKEIHCVGGTALMQGVRMTGMVIAEQWEFSVHLREVFLDENNRLIVHHNDLRLPESCALSDEKCEIKDGPTYLWKEPPTKDLCPYYHVRTVEGRLVNKPSIVPPTPGVTAAQEVFLSTDGAMVRLDLITPSLAKCEAVIYATQYPNLFLTRELENDVLNRPLHPAEFDILTYVNVQDEFLYEAVMDDLEAVSDQWREQRCKADVAKQSTELARRAAEQHVTSEGETANLGNGRFVTAAGEVWYTYQCRSILVEAIVTDDGLCYDALPVQLSSVDMDTLVATLGPKIRERPFYLEPRSRMLVLEAFPMACDHPMAPMYRNYEGRWVTYRGTHHHVSPAPRVLEGLVQEMGQQGPRKAFDFDEGGLYTPSQRWEMTNHKRWARVVDGAGREMVKAIEGNGGWSGRGNPDFRTMIPDLPNADQWGYLEYVQRFWDFLEKYGQLCSVIVATGLVIRLCTWIGGVLLRLYSTPATPNLCLHILAAFFPSLGDFLLRGSYWDGPIAACFGCRRRRHHLQPYPGLSPPPSPPSRRFHLPGEGQPRPEQQELVEIHQEPERPGNRSPVPAQRRGANRNPCSTGTERAPLDDPVPEAGHLARTEVVANDDARIYPRPY
jgi:hypothetical protein